MFEHGHGRVEPTTLIVPQQQGVRCGTERFIRFVGQRVTQTRRDGVDQCDRILGELREAGAAAGVGLAERYKLIDDL